MSNPKMWVRNMYSGLVGGLYTRPSGGMYTGQGGNPYTAITPPSC